MDLKDLFAAHVAAALAHRIERPDVIATRAYDLADAMLRERARRSPSNDEEMLRGAPLDAFDDGVPDDEFFRFTAGLLDEPAPLSDREAMELDPSWLDRENDPQWEVEPKWSPSETPVERPGLKRTTPVLEADEKKRRPA
jgi:hypothetical protein